MAYARKLMASGAYYTGSQADYVYASPSAVVGSIGVIAVDESYQAAFDAMGIKVEIFRAGKYKAPNIAGEGYTQDQRAMEQATVEAMAEEFKQTVLRKRSMANRADMEGQVFTGREAANKNLITGLASTFAEALVAFEQDA
jgi:protease-4